LKIFSKIGSTARVREMPFHEKARDRLGPRADFSDGVYRPVICPSAQAFFQSLIYDAAFASDNWERRRCLSMD
jgi:hypothetical protein